MDPKLYRAAMGGKVDVLFQNTDEFAFQLTPNKNTVLHVAAQYGKTESVHEILRNYPSLLTEVNNKGETPLHIAAKEGHFSVVYALIERARTVKGDLESGVLATMEMLRMTNNDGDTALHEAVRNGDVSVVKLLIEEDPDFPHPYNKMEEAPLYLAVEKGLDDCVSEILKTCTSPSPGGPGRGTALHAAAIFDSQGSMTKLLKWKPGLAKKADRYGWTPLHYAAGLGHVHRVRQLLDSDSSLAYITTNDGNKETALHIAARHGHLVIMECLMSHCPDCCEMVDGTGDNIMHIAVANEKVEVIKFILRHPYLDSLITQTDNDGNTPLHLLAGSHSECLVRELVSHRRAEKVKMSFNKQNRTPLDVYRLKTLEIGTTTLQHMRRDFIKYGADGMRTLVSGYKDEIAAKREARARWYTKGLKERTKAVNTNLIVAALIATVTFAAGFTLPGGYDQNPGQDQGMAVLSRKAAFIAFIVTDTIAVVSSSCAVFIYFVIGDVKEERKLLKHIIFATTLVITAAVSMMVAFITGIYAVLENSQGIAIAVCALGCLSFLIYVTEGISIVDIYPTMRFSNFRRTKFTQKVDNKMMWQQI